jgi:hypothetical protein
MKIQNSVEHRISQGSAFMMWVLIIKKGSGFQLQTLSGAQAGKVDRKLYIGNLPDGTTSTSVYIV